MATKNTSGPSAADIEALTAIVAAAVREAVTPLVEENVALRSRVDALDVCLEGARSAFADLRARVNALEAKPAPTARPQSARRSAWAEALAQVQAAKGHVHGTWEPRDEVLARMEANRATQTQAH